MAILTRTIRILWLVSLLTDISSEMLYPIMPIYLKTIGFSIVFIGVLEGIAEATAGLSKGYFGSLSDRLGIRVLFVRIGYSLSALSKPMLAIFSFPLRVFLARTLDRFGKGVRTWARDAILSQETTPAHKGQVFGFHRALDTAGATIGPSLALLFLYRYPGAYKLLFLLAFVPAILSVWLLFILREKKKIKSELPQATIEKKTASFFTYRRSSPIIYKRVVIGLLAFTLLNSSDVFLLLMMKNQGISDLGTIGIYIFYNLVFALTSYPLGRLGDKIGLKKVLLLGLVIFSLVYLGFGFAHQVRVFLVLFALYGVYAATNEGISKAFISNIVPTGTVATAIGTFTWLQSIFTMLASSLGGLIRALRGPTVMFLVSGVGVLGVGAWMRWGVKGE